jgi:hypothetical protein
MANPETLSDPQGEYLEVILWDVHQSLNDSVNPYIVHKEDTLLLPKPLEWPSSKTWLICRDSSFLSGCNTVWESLSLNNGDSLSFNTCYEERCLFFTSPPAREGISWENYFNTSSSTSEWTLSTSPISSTNLDLGSPGIPPSSLPGLIEEHVVILDFNPQAKTLTLHNLGKQPAKDFFIYQLYDSNGDGKPNLSYDSASCCSKPILPNTSHTFVWPTQNRVQQEYNENVPHTIWSIESDFNPFAETYSHWEPSYIPIQISEICPAPLEGFPEWFEITNQGSTRFFLTHIQYNNQPLISKESNSSYPYYIEPKQSIVVTSSTTLFQEVYPFLQIPILERSPWDILKNTADTLILSVPSNESNHHNTTIDSMSYPDTDPKLIAKEGQCYILNPAYEATSPIAPKWILAESTPGYRQPPPSSFSWSIQPRIINREKGERFEVILEIPPLQEVNVYVMDLSGNKVAVLCESCTGKKHVYWDGTSFEKKNVPIGPYILLVHRIGHSTMKRVIVVGKQL